MLPPLPAKIPKEQRELLSLFKQLDQAEQQVLTRYARFLLADSGVVTSVASLQQPRGLTRPESETVMKALKRLSENYFMLDKDSLLHSCAGKVSDHLLHKRDSDKVIDEIEEIFNGHYESYKSSFE